MKILNGKELAGFIKERQANQVKNMRKKPKLLIIRDSDNPVITKYVNLKIKYGEDIGVIVEDYYAKNTEDIANKILSANKDESIHGIILHRGRAPPRAVWVSGARPPSPTGAPKPPPPSHPLPDRPSV